MQKSVYIKYNCKFKNLVIVKKVKYMEPCGSFMQNPMENPFNNIFYKVWIQNYRISVAGNTVFTLKK